MSYQWQREYAYARSCATKYGVRYRVKGHRESMHRWRYIAAPASTRECTASSDGSCLRPLENPCPFICAVKEND